MAAAMHKSYAFPAGAAAAYRPAMASLCTCLMLALLAWDYHGPLVIKPSKLGMQHRGMDAVQASRVGTWSQ